LFAVSDKAVQRELRRIAPSLADIADGYFLRRGPTNIANFPWRELYCSVLKRGFPLDSPILDVGCGVGTFLLVLS